MTSPTINLLCLPPELIYEIADYLAPDGILALKLTHPFFDATLPLEQLMKGIEVSTCTRHAIRTYLTCPVPPPTHLRCIFCKSTYPVALFSSSSSPLCMPMSTINDNIPREVVELPNRFCAWHVGRLAKVIRTGAGGRNEWVSTLKEMCMHCGEISGWGTCTCSCDSCGVRTVRTYARYLNNDRECRRFLFYRTLEREGEGAADTKGEGVLSVRETCRDHDNNQQTFLEFPVHYEDEDSFLQPTLFERPCSHAKPVSVGGMHATVTQRHRTCPPIEKLNS
ncbi:hypothetical protein P154DRAFT_111652 [Amniculicola lignicola CBS 123094]|uniref:F-box domain-containing protein n=1 Tax=Amniculicola lignicola CBS 123094 TaxID=1392246 RepID=A0A6A5WQ10_9PLEO|nr:hypothetical protein P154DRAFT_111652 [Amniculicola lignicola CBS 123094]